jgi:beta-N-acetylhexosaminidase
LLALFVRFQSGHGSIALPGVTKAAIEKLLDTNARVVAVSFGSPYILRDLPRLPTYLCAWGSQPDMQVGAARALFGETPITGRLPVTIPGLAPRGAGLQKPASESSPLSPREREGVRGELKEPSP